MLIRAHTSQALQEDTPPQKGQADPRADLSHALGISWEGRGMQQSLAGARRALGLEPIPGPAQLQP